MSATTVARITPPWLLAFRPGRAGRLVERNLVLYRRTWLVLVSGVAEPLLYLFSIGVGIGHLVGRVHAGPGGSISYRAYVAPGLLAAAAMNGVAYDATFNLFEKLRMSKLYEAVLATPVSISDVAIGETAWATIRGTLYDIAFLVTMAAMGLISSGWAVLALPAVMLIGVAFATVGIAGTTFVRAWQDFEFVQLVVMPLFLFSATFYPLTVYPHALRVVVQVTPLYQGVALMRSLILGGVGWASLGHAVYLAVMAVVGLVVANRRLTRLLLH